MPDKLVVESYNTIQSQEFDITIVDLPADGSIGFLEGRERLNVAISRAKDGMIVLCNAGGVHGKYAHDSTHYMKEFIEMFDNHEIKVDTEAPLPWPTYYKFHATKHNSFELRD